MVSLEHAYIVLISFIVIISGSKVAGDCTADACICSVSGGVSCPAWMSSFSSMSTLTVNGSKVCVGSYGGSSISMVNSDITWNGQSYEASNLEKCPEDEPSTDTPLCRAISKQMRKIVSLFE